MPPPPETAATAPRRRGGAGVPLALAAVLAAAVAAYARVLHGDFVFDDLVGIVTKGAVHDLGGYLRSGFLDGWLRGGVARPVADLTFALNYAAGGLEPFGYHAVNVGVHLAAVLLVFAFTRETLRRAGASSPAWPAVAVAALFALHPLLSQAVSYVSQRSESLASALYLAALLLLLASEERPGSARGVLLYAAATLAFVAGLGTKIIVVTAPVAYVAHHLWFPAGRTREERRRELARAAARAAPWAALAVASAALTLRGLAGRGDAGFDAKAGGAPLGPWTYLLTEARVVLRYVAMLAVPVGQNLDPDVRVSGATPDPGTVAAALALAALAAIAAFLLLRAARRADPDARAASRVGSFGIAWFFLVLSPTSSVVPIADVMVEHRVYLASWGLLAAAVAGAGALLRAATRSRAAAATLTACACAALGTTLHARNAVWESSVALWSDVVAKSPAKARGWSSLGNALLAHDDARGAARALDRAMELDPSDPIALNTLAVLLLEEGRLADAERRARQSVALAPDQGAPYNTLGEILLREGDAEGAVGAFRRSVALGGDAVPLRVYNLAVALGATRRPADACAAWARYERLEPDPAARDEARGRAAAAGCEAR